MIYFYFLCDSEFKGDLLLQCKQKFKTFGLKFFFANRDGLPVESHDYLFGRVGVVILPFVSTDGITMHIDRVVNFLLDFPLLKFMGLQVGTLFVTPSVWKDLCLNQGSFLSPSYYPLLIASFLLHIYSLQLSRIYSWVGVSRPLLYVSCFLAVEWRPYTNV